MGNVAHSNEVKKRIRICCSCSKRAIVSIDSAYEKLLKEIVKSTKPLESIEEKVNF